MTRIRIEGLLAAFPKLVGTGKQHTYVETDNVRYVYQPLEGVYLVLITNKNSNILEDLETLRTLSKLVPEYCGVGDEESITLGAFDLLFAFDEAISMGLKENVTVPQVRQYTEMDSHEEKLHKMILESKVNETKQQMKAKALQIDKSKVEAKLGGGLGGIGAQGMGGGGMGRGFGMDDPFAGMGMGAPPVRPSPMGGSSFGGSGLGGSRSGGGRAAVVDGRHQRRGSSWAPKRAPTPSWTRSRRTRWISLPRRLSRAAPRCPLSPSPSPWRST